MIQLPALISKRTGAAAKLEKAQGELATAEAARAELQAKLAGLDPESDTYPIDAQTLGAQLSVLEKSIAIISLQIGGLEAKAAAEEERERERRRIAAVAKVEKLLPTYIKAVEDYAAALLGPHTTRTKLTEARDTIARQWPIEDLELPFSFYFDTGRADRALQASIAADDATAKEIAADFVAHECKQLADLLQSLKQPPAEEEKAA